MNTAHPPPKTTYIGLEMTPLRSIFFGHFLLRLSGNKCSQVLSIGKFGPTAPDFGYDFPLYFLLYIVNVWGCWLLLPPSMDAAIANPQYKVENTRENTWEHHNQNRVLWGQIFP